MNHSEKLDSLPTAPATPGREEAKESFHSPHCPACGALKRDGHWFDIVCWKKLPKHIQEALDQARRGRKPGWYPYWLQAMGILEGGANGR